MFNSLVHIRQVRVFQVSTRLGAVSANSPGQYSDMICFIIAVTMDPTGKTTQLDATSHYYALLGNDIRTVWPNSCPHYMFA